MTSQFLKFLKKKKKKNTTFKCQCFVPTCVITVYKFITCKYMHLSYMFYCVLLFIHVFAILNISLLPAEKHHSER